MARDLVNSPCLAAGEKRDERAEAPLRQIGFRNRVWEVHKDLVTEGNEGAPGSNEPAHDTPSQEGIIEEVRVSLQRWDASEGRWPEALLVVKA